MRDDFTQKTKDLLKDRVGGHCSNPECDCETTGPDDGSGTTNIGIACHICAAAPGGPRYDSNQAPFERKSYSNGIWLCSNCSKLIDDNPIMYSREVLNKWKSDAEYRQFERLSNKTSETKKEYIDTRKEALRKINSLIYKIYSIAEYAFNYVEMNFKEDHIFEIQNQLDERPHLHRGPLKYISEHIDLLNELLTIRNNNSLDLSDALNEMLESFSKLFVFAFFSDGGIGLDDDFGSNMLVTIHGNFNDIAELKDKLLQQVKNEY